MDEGRPNDTRGTVKDWPIALVIAGAVFLVGAWALDSGTEMQWLGGLLLAAGVVLLLLRGGAFSPRRR